MGRNVRSKHGSPTTLLISELTEIEIGTLFAFQTPSKIKHSSSTPVPNKTNPDWGKVKYLPRSQAYWIIVKYQGSVSQSPNCWQKKKSWTLYNHLFFKVNSVDWWWNTIMFEAKCCCLVSQMSGSPKLRKRTDEGLASDKYTNSFGDRVQHWVEE